jgi:hypothetical protein
MPNPVAAARSAGVGYFRFGVDRDAATSAGASGWPGCGDAAAGMAGSPDREGIMPVSEHCVNSIADLRALDAGALRCLELLGYYAPGDGGGGEFYWDASSTEPDNGGTIILPASSPATGRWKRLVEGLLSVKWFGAYGDGLSHQLSQK